MAHLVSFLRSQRGVAPFWQLDDGGCVLASRLPRRPRPRGVDEIAILYF